VLSNLSIEKGTTYHGAFSEIRSHGLRGRFPLFTVYFWIYGRNECRAAVLTGLLLFSAGGPPRFSETFRSQCTQLSFDLFMLSALLVSIWRD